MSAADQHAARKDLKRKIVAYLDAYEASARAADARSSLPQGSSRAKVTTANARWASAAEERDRCAKDLPGELHNAIFLALLETGIPPNTVA